MARTFVMLSLDVPCRSEFGIPQWLLDMGNPILAGRIAESCKKLATERLWDMATDSQLDTQ